jgi:2Fe-2S ferredoxin
MKVQLIGRSKDKQVEAETGLSLLDLALKHDVDWGFSCTQGTCARCRCLIESGMEHLDEPTDAELNRLDEEELEDGYRLGCQAVIIKQGDIIARNKTYF